MTDKKTAPKGVAKSKKPTVVAHAQNVRDKANVFTTHSNGFMNFVREQGVIGLAVGLAVGASAGAAVKQIVDGLINPIVGFIIGGINLSKLSWVIVEPDDDGTGGLVLAWGAVVSSLITLVATALVVYWAIHAAKLDRLDKKKG